MQFPVRCSLERSGCRIEEAKRRSIIIKMASKLRFLVFEVAKELLVSIASTLKKMKITDFEQLEPVWKTKASRLKRKQE